MITSSLTQPLQERASENLCFSPSPFFFFLVSVSKLLFHHTAFWSAKWWHCFDCRGMERWVTHLIKMHLHAQSNFTSVFENYSNYFPPFWSIFLPKWPIITYYYWAVNVSLIIHLSFWFAEGLGGCKFAICSQLLCQLHYADIINRFN